MEIRMKINKFNTLYDAVGWLLVCFVLLATADTKLTRKLSHLNVTCGSGNTFPLIKAEGDKDIFYHIWSPKASFVIMMVRTELNSSCRCDATTNPPVLTFDPPPLYSFAVILTELIETNLKNTCTKKFYEFTKLDWRLNTTADTEDYISVIYKNFENEYFNDSQISISLTAYSDEKRSKNLPHLMHTANSSLIDFSLDHTETHFNDSQFGLGFYVINGNSSEDFSKTSSSLIDDEFTPGVFKIIDLSPESTKKGRGGYVQWKPILYTSPDHNHESSSIIQDNGFINRTNGISHQSIVYAFYGENITWAQYTYVTFGMPGESYTSTNYSSWTFSTGYGVPPEDAISTVVIIILTVGLGIPVLLIIGGTLYVFIRRCKVKSDDLSLSN